MMKRTSVVVDDSLELAVMKKAVNKYGIFGWQAAAERALRDWVTDGFSVPPPILEADCVRIAIPKTADV